tara:strand:- start:345 stop:497 length:153 start_codon:yes stop_codon:yes gene_type:complete
MKMKLHPFDRLEKLYKTFKHRQCFTNDSIVMSGDLDELKQIVLELKELEC